LSFYIRFYDLLLCALDVVASGINDIIVQTVSEASLVCG
jgi:hypothetical protein